MGSRIRRWTSTGVIAAALLGVACDSRGAPTYEGRVVAPVMGYQGAPWLMRDSREAEEGTSQLLEWLALTDGMTACDIGVGSGYHAVPMARAVGSGTVLGVDLQQEMLDLLMEHAAAAGVTNVRPVRSSPTDPMLDEGVCDVVLLVDVYHELSDPRAMLAGLRKAMPPTGKMFVVEFRAEDPKVGIKPEHKMTRERVVAEIAGGGHGLKLVAAYDALPIQHVLVFQREDGPAPAITVKPWHPAP